MYKLITEGKVDGITNDLDLSEPNKELYKVAQQSILTTLINERAFVLHHIKIDILLGKIDKQNLDTAIDHYRLRNRLIRTMKDILVDYESASVKEDIYKKIMEGKVNTVDDIIKELDGVPRKGAVSALPITQVQTIEKNRLTCQWWFIRFFETIFNCGKRKIFQVGETCYLTAMLNSILLSNYVKYIIIDKMKAVMEDVESKAYITTELTNKASSCTGELYVYRIVYNMICTDKYSDGISIEPLRASGNLGSKRVAMDLVSLASEDFFCTEDIYGCRTTGGSAISTTYVTLLNTGVAFVIALKSDLQKKRVFRIPKPIEHIRKFPDTQYMFSKLESVDAIPENIDIILYVNNSGVIVKEQDDDIYSFDDIGFKPDTCTISYRTESHDTGHAIAGFSCDGYYRVYDNATNLTFPVNWHMGLRGKKYNFKEFNDFDHLSFSTVLYVNEKKLATYLANGICTA